MAAPKRSKARDFILEAVVARDGPVCFLCGVSHSRTDTMQVDWVSAPNDDLDTAFPACKTCVRRRDGKPIGGYMKARMTAARAEYAYLSEVYVDEVAKKRFNTPIVVGVVPHAVEGTGHAEADPFALPENPTVYNYDRMLPEDFDDDNYPANPKHGDVYYYTGYIDGQDEYVFDGRSGGWKGFAWATKNDIVPEDWPPAGALHHRL